MTEAVSTGCTPNVLRNALNESVDVLVPRLFEKNTPARNTCNFLLVVGYN